MDVSLHGIKPIFCVDVTEDKKNMVTNGAEFIVASNENSRLEQIEIKQSKLFETVKKAKLPRWLDIISWLGLFLFVAVARPTFDIGLKNAFNNAPFLLIGGFSGGLLWLICFCITKKMEKNLRESGVETEQKDEIEEAREELYSDLYVPTSAFDTDIIVFRYKIKNGEVRQYGSAMEMTPYRNFCVKMYVTDNYLNIADIQNAYSFEIEECKSIVRVNKRIAVNDSEKVKDGVRVKNGAIWVKPYYVLVIERLGRRYGIYFPPYELETFELLTGLHAES